MLGRSGRGADSCTSTGREGLLGADSCASGDGAWPPAAPPQTAAERSLAQLAETNRIAADTEALGNSIIGTLGQQRGQLEGAIQTRREAHEGLSISNRLIRQMHFRATWIKIALMLIVLMLIGGVILIIYLHWFSGGDHPPSPPPPPMEFSHSARQLQSATVRLHEPQDGIGAGLIILITVCSLALLSCIFTVPRGIVIRTCVCGCCGFLVLFSFVLLLLLPMEEPPTGATGEPEEIRSAYAIWRIFMITLATLVALGGIGGVFIHYILAPQKAPVVVEAEPVPTYRIAKVMSPA
jgi:flagellar basal body-associated protein FliL